MLHGDPQGAAPWRPGLRPQEQPDTREPPGAALSSAWARRALTGPPQGTGLARGPNPPLAGARHPSGPPTAAPGALPKAVPGRGLAVWAARVRLGAPRLLAGGPGQPLTAQEGLQVALAHELGDDVHGLASRAHGVQPDETLVPQALECLDLLGEVRQLHVGCRRGHRCRTRPQQPVAAPGLAGAEGLTHLI